jgi:hypothetical protein
MDAAIIAEKAVNEAQQIKATFKGKYTEFNDKLEIYRRVKALKQKVDHLENAADEGAINGQ